MSATTREAIISERLGEFGFGQRGRNLPLSARVLFGCPGRTSATLVQPQEVLQWASLTARKRG